MAKDYETHNTNSVKEKNLRKGTAHTREWEWGEEIFNSGNIYKTERSVKSILRRQKDPEFKASLDSIRRTCVRKQSSNNKDLIF